MEIKIPKTKREAYAQLDGMLGVEDKSAIMNGDPFEFDAADSWGYHHEAEWLMNEPWSVVWGYYSDFYLDKGGGVSDLGYPLYLMLLYKLIGSNIFVARVLKAIYGAITCVLLYKLAARNLNEQVGRIAGIFAMVMPNLII